jgi:hypothetical protein
MPYSRVLMPCLFRFGSFYSNEIPENIPNIQIHYSSIIRLRAIPIVIYQNNLHIKVNIIKVYFHNFVDELRLQSSLKPASSSDKHI